MKALRAILAERGETVDAFGVGGPRLQGQGLRAVVDARGLLSMGFAEIVGKIPRFIAALGRLESAARAERPALAVVIDYPDFHFRLARRLRRLGIPVVCFIPPKVWVWRKSRVRELRELYTRVLSILPFEEEVLRAEGVSVRYVGNPLVDELPLQLSREEARRALGLSAADRILAMMPGSRPSELGHHLVPMLDAAESVGKSLRAQGRLAAEARLHVLIPLPATAEAGPVRETVQAWGARAGDRVLEIRVLEGRSAEVLVAADAGLIKSGTSTLEAGVLGCPHLIVFRPNFISSTIFHSFIRYPGPIGLVNLIGGFFGKTRAECVVPELITFEVTAEAMARELLPLFVDEARIRAQREFLAEVRRRVVGDGESPSRKAAREVLDVLVGARPA